MKFGWSNHLMSKRRYHFIIPIDEEWSKNLNTGDGVYKVQSHLLHGLIHCNGFGHLLCINGIQGGSKLLCGREIMDLWDRICSVLQTRKITVEDTSTKRSMDVRLLYGVAYGHSWFGRWGFKFCGGGFGVSVQNYEAALAVLSSINLDEVINTEHDGKRIKQIIQTYRQMSNTQLITFRDLVHLLLSLKTKATVPVQTSPSRTRARAPSKPPSKVNKQHKSLGKEDLTKYKQFSTVANEMESRWPARKLEYAAEVIVDALKERQGGMSRKEVRDAARLHIGDTGLLDYVIKSINNYNVGGYIVKRRINPSTRVREFTVLQVHDNLVVEDEAMSNLSFSITGDAVSDVPGIDIYSDIEYLYHHVLEGYPNSGLNNVATQVVLDSKQFIKEWPFEDEDDSLMRFTCQILPPPEEIETWLTRPLGPCELIVLAPYATLGDLKLAAENAFRDTYIIMERFEVREVEGMNNMDNDEVVLGNVESGTGIWVRGSGMDLDSKLKYECGPEDWTVNSTCGAADYNGERMDQVIFGDMESGTGIWARESGLDLERNFKYEGGAVDWTFNCTCGAAEYDGERMVACVVCEVWQHTRCIGIEDAEDVPPLFICDACIPRVIEGLTESSMNLASCEYQSIY